jgi:hypothetical protein
MCCWLLRFESALECQPLTDTLLNGHALQQACFFRLDGVLAFPQCAQFPHELPLTIPVFSVYTESIASAKCAGAMLSLPARSAIVRAILRTRWKARAKQTAISFDLFLSCN